MATGIRRAVPAHKLSDRPEYKDKQKPLTRPPEATVFDAVSRR